MKIVLTISSLGGGGAERVMAWLADGLSRRGHEVTLLTQMPKSGDRYQCPETVRHISLGGFPRLLRSSTLASLIHRVRWRRLLRRVRAEARPDVVLSFIDAMNISVLLAFPFDRLPVVVSERTDPALVPISRWRTRLRPWLYRHRATRVVFQSQNVAERFVRQWRLSNGCVIPNAVTSSFAQQAVSTGAKCVVSVGRLDPLKGHDVLIEAWALLGPARGDWRLRIIGEGPLRAQYEARIAELGLGDSIELPGFRADVAAELQAASVGVLPSRVEGFPNALIEMMALGLPVIVSDLPPVCKEIITQERDGLLYDGQSPQALAAAIGRLIADADLRDRLGKAALAVRDRYSEERCLQAWTDCLEEAIRCG